MLTAALLVICAAFITYALLALSVLVAEFFDISDED